MQLSVFNRTGDDTQRTVELDESVFGIEPSDHSIWLDVRAAQAHARQGTHKTKERSEVTGSTRKLYRQKGTGYARVGDAKSPIRKGGGTVFGPKPHEYRLGVNRKTKQLARRSALSYKVQEGALQIVEDFTVETPKTREIAGLLKALGLEGRKVLFLTKNHDEGLYRSGRNIPGVTIREAGGASTLDLVQAKAVLIQEGALEPLTESLRKKAKPVAAAVAENGDTAGDTAAATE